MSSGYCTAKLCVNDVDVQVHYRGSYSHPNEIAIEKITIDDKSGSQSNLIGLLSADQINELEKDCREDWAEELKAMADLEDEVADQMAVL